MKAKLILGSVVAMAFAALAATPLYITKNAGGTSSAGAEVIFPAQDGAQIRLVSANWKSDSATAVLSCTGGSTAYSIVETNVASSSVTNKINSTNGLAPNGILVLQHGGVCYKATISGFNQSTNTGAAGGTNVVLASGGWGVSTTVGDSVYLMDTAVSLPIGATTNVMNGEALYVAALPGRPVRVVLTPASSTNTLNSVVARYE